MAHRSPNYIAVIVMMAVALAGSILFARRPDNVSASADVRQIPARAGDWKLVEDVALDANTMKQILADSYVSREYANSKGQQVQLLVVYRRYGRREFAHRPELCFPAAGFSVRKNEDATLYWAGRDVPVKYMTAFAPNLPETAITYFFASGKRTEENFLRQQWKMAFERLLPNKNGWTFLRLTSPVAPGAANGERAALEAQQDFMRAFAPEIEAIITTDTGSGRSAMRPAQRHRLSAPMS